MNIRLSLGKVLCSAFYSLTLISLITSCCNPFCPEFLYIQETKKLQEMLVVDIVRTVAPQYGQWMMKVLDS